MPPTLHHGHEDLSDLPERPRVYGGHPSPLADPERLEWARQQLLTRHAVDVAAALGYSRVSTFSDAFSTATGERPTAYQRRHGVTLPRRRPGTYAGATKRPRDRTHLQPLPRYNSKATKRSRKRRKSA